MTDSADILGYKIDLVNMQGTLDIMEQYIASGQFHQIVLGNIYCATEARHDPEFLNVSRNADLTLADGISLVWASRLLGKRGAAKVSGWELFGIFSEIAARKGYTFFLVGGGPGGSEKVAEVLTRKYPALKILGTYSPQLGPISDAVNDEILRQIDAASPDVVWVGLGSPRQEKWIWHNRRKLNTRIALGVGSAFDFQMGRQKRAPMWMVNHGLEWLYRPTQDPTVLWRKRFDRYFPEFVLPVLMAALRRQVYVRQHHSEPKGLR